MPDIGKYSLVLRQIEWLVSMKNAIVLMGGTSVAGTYEAQPISTSKCTRQLQLREWLHRVWQKCEEIRQAIVAASEPHDVVGAADGSD